MEKEENIVKRVCKELGLTYKQLGEKIGVAEGTIKQNAVKENVSEQITKALEILLENKELKEQLQETEQLKAILKNFTK
jgi:transcriptional regulator with XRE-family HTH domain